MSTYRSWRLSEFQQYDDGAQLSSVNLGGARPTFGRITVKLMLTSFGIESNLLTTARSDTFPLAQHRGLRGRDASGFFKMPPVSFRLVNQSFMPDYELLVLCDQVVMDESSFYRLIERPAPAYAGVAETFKALKGEGRVELVDFSAILHSNTELLDKMLRRDVGILDQWVLPLRESLTVWASFSERIDLGGLFDDESHLALDGQSHGAIGDESLLSAHIARNQMQSLYRLVQSALESSEKRKRKVYRDALREVLQPFLSYVNANLVLSNELGVGFHDWRDFMPFYSMKFLGVGKGKDATQESRRQVEKLFTVAFPDLAITTTSALLRALNDKRIEELRQLISDAAAGKTQFDEHFANSVLTDVLRSERKSSRMRKVLGYLTLPIGFIPLIGTPAQKIIEEAVGTPLEKKIKQNHKWFYMLSDFADPVEPTKPGLSTKT